MQTISPCKNVCFHSTLKYILTSVVNIIKLCNNTHNLKLSFKWPWPSKSGGDSLEEAFEQCATSMFGYMTTDYNTVEMKEEKEVEAEGNKKSYITFCLCLHKHTCMLFQYANQFRVLFITNMYNALLKRL